MCGEAKVTMVFVYRERPVINTSTVDLNYLQSLLPGTFGREYADWLHVNVCTMYLVIVCFCCFVAYLDGAMWFVVFRFQMHIFITGLISRILTSIIDSSFHKTLLL